MTAKLSIKIFSEGVKHDLRTIQYSQLGRIRICVSLLYFYSRIEFGYNKGKDEGYTRSKIHYRIYG
jgi:hypothetical protein